MTIVAQFSWDDIASEDFSNPARRAWRQAVAEIADKARAKLPECSGRVDSAVKIVLAGDVELLADGTAKVASQSNGSTAYHVFNGECSCKDLAKAPHGFCKHVRFVHLKLAMNSLGDRWEGRKLLTNSISMWVQAPLRGVRYKHIPQGSD